MLCHAHSFVDIASLHYVRSLCMTKIHALLFLHCTLLNPSGKYILPVGIVLGEVYLKLQLSS